MFALPAHYEQDGVAADYRDRFSQSVARRLSHFLEMRMLVRAIRLAGEKARVLDVPCGAGRLVPTLAAHAEEIVCVDAAGAMLREARSRADVAAAKARFVRASAFALPFDPAAFDVVVCWRLVHHLPDAASRARLFSELRRVANRAVVISFSDAETLRGRRLALRGIRPGRRSTIDRATLASELRAHGLVPLRFFRLFGPFSAVAAVAAAVRP